MFKHMRTFSLAILITLLFPLFSAAQTGCPGCQTEVPPGLPADTVYLPGLPDGQFGAPYDESISFRLPKTTTPVYALDSVTQPGLAISKFEIVAIDGLPAGLHWQPNKSVFDMTTETDGCLRICGTPFEHDSFSLSVTLRATIFFLTQEATFPMKLYIAPKVSNTAGFSLTDPEGCGSTTVSFTNLIPSGGNPGISYEWDFGDGSPVFTGENPPPHTYSGEGMYEVSCKTVIDTIGYRLESIRVLQAACSDAFGLGLPDMYIQISAPNNGGLLFDSSPDVPNVTLPYSFNVGLTLGNGNYQLRVVDEDSGVEGADDECGSVSFNLLSNDTIVAGGLIVVMNIIHPVEEIISRDTVIVHPMPVTPVLLTPNGSSACAGATNLILVSSYGSGNEWLRNNALIGGATDFFYKPAQTGYYQARIISQDGCVATSDSTLITFFEHPAEPVWYNYNNSLRVYDTTALPNQYALQWYKSSNPIPGETGIWYCTKSNGYYGLVVTDLETGCTSSYFNLVPYNPAYDCTVSADSPVTPGLSVYPNPATSDLYVQLPAMVSECTVSIYDMTGRVVQTTNWTDTQQVRLDVSTLGEGIYWLEVWSEEYRYSGKFVRR
jgi:hypothetical protein